MNKTLTLKHASMITLPLIHSFIYFLNWASILMLSDTMITFTNQHQAYIFIYYLLFLNLSVTFYSPTSLTMFFM